MRIKRRKQNDKRKSEMKSAVKEQMRGGDGRAVVTDILSKGEYKGKARLVGTITLSPDVQSARTFTKTRKRFFMLSRAKPYITTTEKKRFFTAATAVSAQTGRLIQSPTEQAIRSLLFSHLF